MNLVKHDMVEGIVSDEVREEDVQDIIEEFLPHMRLLLRETGGVGLTGIQVGIAKKFSIYYPDPQDRSKEKIVFNCKYFKDGNRIKHQEGCLSYELNNFIDVKRFKSIKAVYDEWDGEKLVRKTEKLKGFEAVVFQHETDHQNGITIFTRK